MRGKHFKFLRYFFNELLAAFILFPRVLIMRISGKVNIVHFHGESYVPLISLLCKRFLDLPIIVTSHGEPAHFFQLRNSRIFLWIWSKTAKSVNHLAIVGKPLKDRFLYLGFEKSKIITIHNGHDSQAGNRSLTERFRERYQNKIILVSVARLVELKGIDTTLKAISIVKKVFDDDSLVYVHVGDGPIKGKLQKIVEDFALDDTVQFLGHLTYGDAMSVMKSGDIFVLPSWGDAFGIVYLEAMSRGLPSIGCRGAGAEETIVDGETGFLIDKDDAAALARTIIDLILDAKKRKRLALAAEQHAKLFTWARNAERYSMLYESLLVTRDRF